MQMPAIYSDVSNWWYHYYSRGFNKKVFELSPLDFVLAEYKVTPDFSNLIYEYSLCHPQIGRDRNLTPGKSIVILKTTVGMPNPSRYCLRTTPFIVGYYRVKEVKSDCILMDAKDSLLILDNPIQITLDLAKKLFPDRPNGYWSNERTLAQKVGQITRNRHAKERELRTILPELLKRRLQGATNFMGLKYSQLISRLPRQEKIEKYF